MIDAERTRRRSARSRRSGRQGRAWSGLAADADGRVPLGDDEEAGASGALGRHSVALGEAALVHLVRERLEVRSSSSAKSGTSRRASTGADIGGDHRRRGGPVRRRRSSRRCDAGCALRGDRPRALVVGGGAPRAGADEARPQAPSVPRQVRPAARRGLPAPLRLARPARLGPVRRLGDDARRGERLRRARGRVRHLGLQLPARAREDRRVRPRVAARRVVRALGRARPARSPRRRRTYLATGSPRARSPSCSPSASGSTEPRIRISGGSSSPAPPARRGSRATSTSTSRPSPCQGEYFCHKHRRVCRPVEEAEKFLRRYVRDAVPRVQEFADVRSAAERLRRPRRRAADRPARPGRPRPHLAAVPGPDRLPRAARLRLRAPRPRAPGQRRDRPRREGLLRGHRRRSRPRAPSACGLAAGS